MIEFNIQGEHKNAELKELLKLIVNSGLDNIKININGEGIPNTSTLHKIDSFLKKARNKKLIELIHQLTLDENTYINKKEFVKVVLSKKELNVAEQYVEYFFKELRKKGLVAETTEGIRLTEACLAKFKLVK